MREWLEETPENRAKCVAHFIHRNLRSQYNMEHSNPDSEGNQRALETRKSLTAIMG